MKCPFGYDHPVTWRCYVVYAADWLAGVIPESWPLWTMRPFLAVIMFVEDSDD